MSEPKEFWIRPAGKGDRDIIFDQEPVVDGGNWQNILIHVIEYSAFEAERKKVERLENENESLRQEITSIEKAVRESHPGNYAGYIKDKERIERLEQALNERAKALLGDK